MPSHPLDFQLQANFFATPELLAVFDEQRKMNRWLQVEAALARAQADLGIIPEAAAQEIAAKAGMEHLDLEGIKAAYRQSRNSLVPVLKGLRQACGEQYGEFVHYGATTQDILDTGQVLELKEALQIFFRDLRRLEELLVALSRRHRQTAMIGRTHGQQALPTTFGLKTATWAIEVRRQIERLKGLYPRVTVGQLSGAVGTMAALGPQAREVATRTMALLGLQRATVSWHTSRDNMAEAACLFGLLAGTFEKIANEIFLLGKTEVGELAEPAPAGAQSSSTMPHKRNPVLCQRVAVLGRHIRLLATGIMESMVQEHERDPRCLWSEWLAMPQICIYTGTAAAYLIDIVEGLEVRESAMRENLYRHKDAVLSEWVLFRLAPGMGKMKAQEKLQALLRQAGTEGLALKEALRRDPEVRHLLGDEDLNFLDHPERYIGLAPELVEDALTEIAAGRQADPRALAS